MFFSALRARSKTSAGRMLYTLDLGCDGDKHTQQFDFEG
jgi:hypothetical protein